MAIQRCPSSCDCSYWVFVMVWRDLSPQAHLLLALNLQPLNVWGTQRLNSTKLYPGVEQCEYLLQKCLLVLSKATIHAFSLIFMVHSMKIIRFIHF